MFCWGGFLTVCVLLRCFLTVCVLLGCYPTVCVLLGWFLTVCALLGCFITVCVLLGCFFSLCLVGMLSQFVFGWDAFLFSFANMKAIFFISRLWLHYIKQESN